MTTTDNTLIMRSKIKKIFPEEVLKYIGSICDTKRIDSAQKKMQMLQQLLKRYEIRFDVLGGATNRLALFIDGYAFKFAMDRQGYKDNLMEYSLSKELQPYVTKTYETNGYILVAEPVKTMTMDDFHLRKIDILKVLEVLATDYLLGDVGYIKKNFTNWGIRDDGRVVILDFAYIHRGTENLFTCDVCGDGLLVYDSTYSYLRCNNGTVCQTKYSYHERKVIQGDQVDFDMIDEAKGYAIVLGQGEKTKEVQVVDGAVYESGKYIINSFEDYQRYIKEVKLMLTDNFNAQEAADLMIDRMRAKTPEEIKLIDGKLEEMVGKIDDINEEFVAIGDANVEGQVEDVIVDAMQGTGIDVEDTPVPDAAYALDTDVMTEMVKSKPPQAKPVEVVEENPPEDGYVDIDPLDAAIEEMRRKKGKKSPYGYSVITNEEHYPVSTVITNRKGK